MDKTIEISDSTLIEQLTGSQSANSAITYIYEAHYELLARFIVNNNGTQQDAQDIFQEVVVAFINLVRLGKFRGESSIKTFLYALTRNLWLNELKRRNRTVVREKKYEMKNERKEPTISTQVESREASKQLLQVMNELGESCKQILLLFYYGNESMKEIVAKTAYENEQVVRNKKYKCLKKLEEKLTANPALLQQLKNLLYE